MMKNIALAAVLAGLLSLGCNRGDNWEEDIDSISVAPVDSVKIPDDTIALGAGVSINTYSRLQRDCEIFYKFDYAADGEFTRTVTAYKLKNKSVCDSAVSVATDFLFVPKSKGVYALKFRTSDGWLNKTLVVN